MKNEKDQLWNKLLDLWIETESLKKEFLSDDKDGILAVLRKALSVPSERLYALRILKDLDVSDRQKMMPALLAYATWQNAVTDLAKELVFSVPRDWLKANFVRCAEAGLHSSDSQEIWGILDIASHIDRELALQLTRHFIDDENADIRDAARTWVEKLFGTL